MEPLRSLHRKLRPDEARAVAADVRGLLQFQEGLASYRAPRSKVAAMPFVALYARGKLRACMGSDEGGAGERLVRAFLAALGDVRFGGIPAGERESLVAEVSYVRAIQPVAASEVLTSMEVGTHGVGVQRAGGLPVILLPSVARDLNLDPKGMLDALKHKTRGASEGGELFLFETETVTVRRPLPRRDTRSGEALALSWLESLVDADGAVTFATHARTGKTLTDGEMHHGRAAVVLQALAASGRRKQVEPAFRRMKEEIVRALSGEPVAGWPTDIAMVAGSLALAEIAGLDVREELTRYAAENVEAIAKKIWHAAQVVAALGQGAPPPLWDVCFADLAPNPWAPWTAIAAAKRGDAVPGPLVEELVRSVRTTAPHEGAVTRTGTAETALTALVVEALTLCPKSAEVSAAVKRGRAFLEQGQLRPGRVPGALSIDGTLGAFLPTPTSAWLRCDVTAHAVLALRGGWAQKGSA